MFLLYWGNLLQPYCQTFQQFSFQKLYKFKPQNSSLKKAWINQTFLNKPNFMNKRQQQIKHSYLESLISHPVSLSILLDLKLEIMGVMKWNDFKLKMWIKKEGLG